MKGQMFLIASIILLLGIITLANIMNVYSIFEEMRHTEASDLEYKIENLAHEYEYLISMISAQSQINSENIQLFTANISNYENADIFFLIAYANNSGYTVWAGNYLNDNINFTLNMSYSGTSSWVQYMPEKSVYSLGNTAIENRTLEMNISYTLNNIHEAESFPFKVNTIANNSVIGFFDIKLSQYDNFARRKVFVNRTW